MLFRFVSSRGANARFGGILTIFRGQSLFTIRQKCDILNTGENLPSIDKDTHGFDGQKNVHTSSKALPIHEVFPAAFSSSGRFSATAKLLAPDSNGFSCDFWLLRRRCVVTPRNQIKAQQSGFDLKRKKERAKCSFRRKAETKWRKFLLTMRKGQKAPERHAVRRVCSCQPRVI